VFSSGIGELAYVQTRCSEMTADFVPGAANWRTGQNICMVLDSGPFTALCEHVVRTTATGICTKNLVKDGSCVVSEVCEQTDRHIDTDLIATLSSQHP